MALSSRVSKDFFSPCSTVKYINILNEHKTLTFSELRTLAATEKKEKNRDLFRVSVVSRNEDMPSFKLLSFGELEVAVRKARQFKTGVSERE